MPEGRNTLQSLQAVEQVMAAKGWELGGPGHRPVAQPAGSRTMARDQGIARRRSPTRAGPSVRTRGTQLRYIARETLAFLYYKVLGRSGEAGPSAV